MSRANPSAPAGVALREITTAVSAQLGSSSRSLDDALTDLLHAATGARKAVEELARDTCADELAESAAHLRAMLLLALSAVSRLHVQAGCLEAFAAVRQAHEQGSP
jgi:hypothetical protein